MDIEVVEGLTPSDGTAWKRVIQRGAWKNRKLRTETDTETDGGNRNTQAIITLLQCCAPVSV